MRLRRSLQGVNNEISKVLKSNLVLQVTVLREDEQLVFQLLTELQGDREQHQHLAQPRYGALRLIDVEARIAVRVLLETVVDRADKFV